MSEKMLQQIVTMLSDMRVHFDKLEDRFDKLEDRHNQLDKNMHAQFSEQNKKLDAISEQVAKNTELLTVHTSHFIAMKDDMKLLEQKSNDTISTVEVINGKMENKDSDIVVLNNRLFKLESTVQKLVNL